ncbi:MAG: RNA polymerase sigma factor [Elusimicrobiaceae bacterium]|nr:RNA polymerase sigma factor [Elusimicrobiaceae bacterium]MBQ6223596.1 RNA polymerase sigma factor [Campylobacter sp.]
MQDELIIKEVKSGNKEKFSLLVEKYQDTLFTFIYYSLRDEASAKDILQETFIKALKEIDKYKEEGKFKAWLWTIARNKVMDFYRKAGKIVPLEEEALNLNQGDETSKKAFSKLELSHIESIIENLPTEQKEVVLLRQYLSFKEIAAVLDCPLGTVLARLNRAIKKIQKSLGEEYAA